MDATIACPCPPKADGGPRHEADVITLRDRLDYHSATTIRKALGLLYLEDPEASTAEALATITEHYLLMGIAAWTLVDDKGKPIDVSKAAIRRVLEEHADEVQPLADQADALYAEQVMLPLMVRAQKSSQPSPTDESTSAKNSSQAKRPRPSRPSSTTTSPTDATGTITRLPVGASSSLPNSRSAR